jgi:MerR family transcriptional regulator, copper efflux regulator
MPRQLNGYLTVKEAAAFLGTSPATLRNWDRAGKLTPCRHPVNSYRLYRKEDLERILRQAEAMGGSRSRASDLGTAADEGCER